MRRSLIAILLVYLAVAAAEIALHAYMAYCTSDLAADVHDWYLRRSAVDGAAFNTTMAVIVAPGVLLGLAAGGFGRQWKPERLLVCIIVLALGLVALYPIYALVMPAAAAYCWPPGAGPRLATLGTSLVKSIIACGGFAFFTWAIFQWYAGRPMGGGPRKTAGRG